LSGILVGQEADVIAAYPGLTSLGVEREGEWVSLAFRAPA
jgi:ribosomal protein L11 methylase PrmA